MERLGLVEDVCYTAYLNMSINKWVIMNVFIDAYGDPDLEVGKSGATTHFIVTAVLVSNDLDRAQIEAEEVRVHHFQTGEIKSSSIGTNDSRRIRILKEISKLPIHTFSIAVDKRELNKDGGLAYKKSFFKYVHRMLCERIYRSFAITKIVADEHGGTEFMRGFRDYIYKIFPLNLFTKLDFRFAKSHDEVLLQIADLISGSIARCVDPKKISSESAKIRELIAARSLGVHTWPRDTSVNVEPKPIPGSDPMDALVQKHCMRQVDLFLAEHQAQSDNDDPIRAQVAVLQYLLYLVEYVDESAFVTTDEILKHLNDAFGIEMSPHELRARVISQLRDSGVLVASGRGGYKLPISVDDISEFVRHAQTIVPPMLSRVRIAYEALHLSSSGELDILAPEEFGQLRSLINLFEDSRDNSE